ncbi:MAG: lysylphosphatidylglycerol synthase domain-containing protein [Chloroherpetonaceae bacterium]|nr:lysylphosphatidylglycerol synthase domain-containing protein [Chloroherpetonaceae bacterium]
MKKEKSILSKTFRYAIFGLVLLLFINLISEANWVKIIELVRSVGWYALLIPIPYLATSFFDTLGWKFVIDSLGNKVSLLRLFSIRLSTEAMLLSLPAGAPIAEGAKAYLVSKIFKLPFSEAMAGVVVKKSLLGIAHSFYILFCVIVGFQAVELLSIYLFSNSALGWVMIGMALVMFALFTGTLSISLNGDISSKLHRFLSKISISAIRNWLLEAEKKFLETDNHLSKFKEVHWAELFLSVIFFLIGWLFEAFETLVLLWLLGAVFEWQNLVSIEVTLSLVRSLAFVIPAGLGIQDSGYIAALQSLNFEDAVSLAVSFLILKRAKELFSIFLGYGLLSLMGLNIRDTVSEVSKSE